MAIYIKGMKMPKNCEECFLVDSCDDKHWEITKDDMGYKGEYVKDNCPLTEVSEPHGRLIDADALFDSLNIRSVTYNCVINKCIEDAPTVIEGGETE